MMKRSEAFDRLSDLATRTEAPTALTPDDARALAVLLPEFLESRPVDWETYAPAPVERECRSVLKAIGERHGLQACDDDGARCYFPRCLADGCEAERAAPPEEKPPTCGAWAHCNLRGGGCGWRGPMASLAVAFRGVTHCPECGGTAIEENLPPEEGKKTP